MSHVKQTAKYALIYTVGVLLERAVSFIMLPIYTRYLTPSDYGALELLTMTLDIVAMIAGLGISEAVFRFYYKTDDAEYRKTLISTVTILLIISYLSASLIGLTYSERIALLVLKGVRGGLLYTRLIFACLFLQSLIIVPLVFIKAQQKPVLFVVFTTMKLVLQLSLNIYFVVVLRMHVLGVLYSSLIASVIIGLFLSVYTFRTTGLRFSIDISGAIIRFGAPLTVSSLASFILTFSDRYFLKVYSTVTEVGIYSLGYKFGFVLWMFAVRPLFNIWDPKRFEIAKKPESLQINKKMFVFLNLLMISFGLAISLFSADLFRIMSASGFWNAYKVVPIIIFAYIVQGWTVFTNFGVFYKGKTIYVAYGNIVAAVFILMFSFLLIPTYGGYGAALSTVLAFFVRFCIIYYQSQKYYKLDLDWDRTLLLLLIALSIYGLSRLVDHSDLYFSVFVNLLLFSMYTIVLFIAPVLDQSEKEAIFNVIRHPILAARAVAMRS